MRKGAVLPLSKFASHILESTRVQDLETVSILFFCEANRGSVMAGALDASAAKRQRLLQHINAVAEASTAEKAGAEGPPEAAVRSDDEARVNGLSDIKVLLLLRHLSSAPVRSTVTCRSITGWGDRRSVDIVPSSSFQW
jgi:hypothetical protein